MINSFVLLPFLCEVHIFLWQDGEDLVKHLVCICLTSQSHIVLGLEEDTDTLIRNTA